MKKELSRIKEIASYIKPYKRIADVGCDHGYLIIEAFENYDIDYALAIDNKKGPLERCKLNIESKDYKDKVRFSLSSGISDLDSLIEVVVLAGMGGMLIKKLLNDNLYKLNYIKRIIIQANKDNYVIRKFLTDNYFDIINESIVYEDNKYYQIICFDKVGYLCEYNDDELEYGPINIKKRDTTFIDYLNSLLFDLNNINYDNEKIRNKKIVIERLINNENK